ALAQVGKPYVYGGTGPDGFDCSGLVMEAYASAGVTLPRVAQDQYDFGPQLAAGTPLQPGDIVFFGTPTAITHDGIYIGNGMMVDAPHTGADVRVESYLWSDFAGATRPAGDL
ncbi:MAG: C40 family peptidase, partial [Acidimicrobiales bacterium]